MCAVKNIKRDIIIFVTVLLTVGLFVFLNCVYDLTDLDVLVKLSRIATPILVVGFGFLINRKLNEQKHYLEREFEIKQSWAHLFYQTVLKYNNTLTELMSQIQYQNFVPVPNRNDYSDDSSFQEAILQRQATYDSSIKLTLNKLLRLTHDIDVYGSYSEKTLKVRNVVNGANDEYRKLIQFFVNPTSEEYNAGDLGNAQKKIVIELLKFQKIEILGKTP